MPTEGGLVICLHGVWEALSGVQLPKLCHFRSDQSHLALFPMFSRCSMVFKWDRPHLTPQTRGFRLELERDDSKIDEEWLGPSSSLWGTHTHNFSQAPIHMQQQGAASPNSRFSKCTASAASRPLSDGPKWGGSQEWRRRPCSRRAPCRIRRRARSS